MSDQTKIFLDIIFGPDSICFYREFNKDRKKPNARSNFDTEELEKSQKSEVDNIRIELKITQVFHKVLNMIKGNPDLFQREDFELLGEMLFKILFGKDATDPRHREVIYIIRELANNPNARCRFFLRSDNDKIMVSLPWEYTRFKYEDLETNELKSFYLAANIESKFQLIRNFGSINYKPKQTKNLNVILIICDKGNGEDIGNLIKAGEEVINLFEEIKKEASDKNNKFRYEVIQNPEFSDLSKNINEKIKIISGEESEPYCIHYFGHSSFKNEHGKLVFMKNKNADWFEDSKFSLIFNPESKNAIRPEMIVFQSCDSGKIGVENNSLTGIPIYMTKQSIPAVIAMQNEINPDISNGFFSKFYNSILDGEDVAEAVTVGRDFLGRIMYQPEVYKNNCFGSPVLFITTKDPIKLLDIDIVSKDIVNREQEDEQVICSWCKRSIEKKYAPNNNMIKCLRPGCSNKNLTVISVIDETQNLYDDAKAVSTASGKSSNDIQRAEIPVLDTKDDNMRKRKQASAVSEPLKKQNAKPAKKKNEG